MSDIIKLFQDYNYADWQASFLQEVCVGMLIRCCLWLTALNFNHWIKADEMAYSESGICLEKFQNIIWWNFDLTYEDIKTIDIIESLE